MSTSPYIPKEPNETSALIYLQEVQEKFADNKNVLDTFHGLLKDLLERRLNEADLPPRIKELFAGEANLILGFNNFLPVEHHIQIEEVDEINPERNEQGKVNQLNNEHTANVDACNLDQRKEETLDWNQVGKSSASVEIKANESNQEAVVIGNDLKQEEERKVPPNVADESTLAYVKKVKMRFIDKQSIYVSFVEILYLYKRKRVSLEDLKQQVHRLFRMQTDLLQEFKGFLRSQDSGPSVGMKRPLEAAVPDSYVRPPLNMRMRKPNRDVQAYDHELKSLPRVTPSYVEVPGYHVLPRCSGRTPLGNAVLNDRLVQVRKRRSNPASRRGGFERMLFQYEDDRYQLEMSIESNAWAIRCLRPLSNYIGSGCEKKLSRVYATIATLPAVVVHAIERLYADQGTLLVEMLQESPIVAVPVVLARLEQKDKEWRDILAKLNEPFPQEYLASLPEFQAPNVGGIPGPSNTHDLLKPIPAAAITAATAPTAIHGTALSSVATATAPPLPKSSTTPYSTISHSPTPLSGPAPVPSSRPSFRSSTSAFGQVDIQPGTAAVGAAFTIPSHDLHQSRTSTSSIEPTTSLVDCPPPSGSFPPPSGSFPQVPTDNRPIPQSTGGANQNGKKNFGKEEGGKGQEAHELMGPSGTSVDQTRLVQNGVRPKEPAQHGPISSIGQDVQPLESSHTLHKDHAMLLKREQNLVAENERLRAKCAKLEQDLADVKREKDEMRSYLKRNTGLYEIYKAETKSKMAKK